MYVYMFVSMYFLIYCMLHSWKKYYIPCYNMYITLFKSPQKSTTDAAMVVKQFVEPELERGRVVIMASLEVKGALQACMYVRTYVCVYICVFSWLVLYPR